MRRVAGRERGHPGAGVYDVPAQIDHGLAMLQLEAMGVRIDSLDPAQEAYLTSWRNGG